MRKVIDLECDLPPDENGTPRKLEAATHPPGYGDPERLPPLQGHGFSNYACIFTRRGDDATGRRPAIRPARLRLCQAARSTRPRSRPGHLDRSIHRFRAATAVRIGYCRSRSSRSNPRRKRNEPGVPLFQTAGQAASAPRLRSSPDSPLERARFEPSVPRERQTAFRATVDVEPGPSSPLTRPPYIPADRQKAIRWTSACRSIWPWYASRRRSARRKVTRSGRTPRFGTARRATSTGRRSLSDGRALEIGPDDQRTRI
jgi:hypothetical protein